MPLLTSPGSATVNRKPYFVPLDDKRRDFNAGAMATAIAAVRRGLNSTPLSEPPSKPEPDLQVLRKRTPEQEEAIAAAAAAIAEAAAKSEEASEEEREPATIRKIPGMAGKVWWDALDGDVIEECLEHTPLVDIMFLVLLARLGGVLPCGRQNMPPAAFITKDNLWRLKLWNKKENKASLPVLAFSYAWLDSLVPPRPDGRAAPHAASLPRGDARFGPGGLAVLHRRRDGRLRVPAAGAEGDRGRPARLYPLAQQHVRVVLRRPPTTPKRPAASHGAVPPVAGTTIPEPSFCL